MLPLKLDYGYLAPDISMDLVRTWQDIIDFADKKVTKGGGEGSDFLGWVDPNDMVSASEMQQIRSLASELRENCDYLVVIGIGGSYLGARAVIEALGHGDGPQVLFAGNSLSAHYHAEILRKIGGKRFGINVISKSGTTTEPAVSFRLFREALEKQVGKEAAKKRIVATTDAKKGALRKFADEEDYASLVVPDDVGGRYSVLTPVGLLPIAYAGIDIDQLREGASACAKSCSDPDVTKNPSTFYAVARNLLYRQGKTAEIFASFEPRLHYVAEWWKQLYGESEGKDHISLFPASVDLTTDLHSMGQWIQQGRRNIIETFVIVDGGEEPLPIPQGNNLDELGYLAGKDLSEVNRAAYRATALAHRDGGVPNQTVHLDQLNAFSLGALLYFFERACGISGYLMGVNPFNQPGVEAYKTNMFALLGKPGYEQATKDVQARLSAQKQGTVVSFS
ncbi:MAG TPA: glucose-6-phosphate isomerase [Capsulimonadaceae bacterium]|nr:glucose-6-phosphate isomerase [Capsulimonadaceae bacterium]